MQTKRLILTMSVALVIIFGWQFLMFRLYGPPQRPAANVPTTAPVATTGSTTQTVVGGVPTGAVPATQQAATPATTAATQGAASMSAAAMVPAASTTAPSVIALGESAEYSLRLNVTTMGAAIADATLKDFPSSDGKGRYTFQKPYNSSDASTYSMALRTVTVNETAVNVTGATWKVEEKTGNSARLSLEIQNLGQPMVRVVRTYTLKPKNDASKGLEPAIAQSFVNLTKQPLTVRMVANGPTMPPHESDQHGRGGDLQVIAGYNNEGETVAYNHLAESFTEKQPSLELVTSDKKQPILWFGTASIYFNSVWKPESLDPKNPSPKYVSHVKAEALNLSSDAADKDIRLSYETDTLTVPANQSVDLPGFLFLGPKQRSLLQENYYAAFPRSYNTTLVIASGMCGVCTFQWLISILVNILGFFHMVLRDWGLAIIALVLLVRAILHPITKRSQVSMMKMGKMGPEVERLKKKYGDDKDELNKAMMSVYKEQGFTPVLGCLPMFLQMPIWIALWSALQSTFELRQAPFLYGLTWIHDLAKPDQLIKFAQPIPLMVFGWHLSAINLLPLLMIGVTYLNSKYMPQPPATTPEQLQQQKMMKWMTMVFPLMFYSMPSGLNLYYVTSMGLGIVESKIIRDHIKQKELEEKEGKVIVDAPRSMKKKRDDEGGIGGKRKGPKDPPKGFFGKMIADMQAKVEEVRKQAEKK